MKIYIRTRSCFKDYKWIAEPPKTEWWKKGGRHYNTDYPLIYVSKDNDLTKIFMSGIPSARVDKSKAGIRYDIAIELDNKNDNILISEFVAPLVSEFILLLRKLEQNKFELPQLSLNLDEIFTEDALSLFFNEVDGVDYINRYNISVAKFKQNFKIYHHDDKFTFSSESWVGSISSNEAFNKFNEFIIAILFSKINCIALYANLVESIGSVDSLFEILYDDNITVAILTPMDINTCPGIKVLQKKKPQNTPTSETVQTQNNWKLTISISIIILTILTMTLQCQQNKRSTIPPTTQDQPKNPINKTDQVILLNQSTNLQNSLEINLMSRSTNLQNSLEIKLMNSPKILSTKEPMIIKATSEIQMNQKTH